MPLTPCSLMPQESNDVRAQLSSQLAACEDERERAQRAEGQAVQQVRPSHNDLYSMGIRPWGQVSEASLTVRCAGPCLLA